MEPVASTTRIRKSGCPVRVHGKDLLGALRFEGLRTVGVRSEGLRRFGVRSVCRIAVIASTTPIPETGCPVRSDGELHPETFPLERFRRVVYH